MWKKKRQANNLDEGKGKRIDLSFSYIFNSQRLKVFLHLFFYTKCKKMFCFVQSWHFLIWILNLKMCVLQIHEKLRQYERQSPTPVLHSAASLAEDVSLSYTYTCTHTHHTHAHSKLLFHLGTAVSNSELAQMEKQCKYQK